MNRKILVVLIVAAVVAVGCAYAADSTSNADVITISDVNFTIPDGFIEDADGELVDEPNADQGRNYVTSQKIYDNGNKTLVIGVNTFEENITDDYVSDFGEKTTINNITGYYDENSFFSMFSYIDGEKLIVITTDDKATIEEVLA